jgi:hypothetical protein
LTAKSCREMMTRHRNTDIILTPNTIHRIFIHQISFFFLFPFFFHSFVTLSHHHVSLTTARPPYSSGHNLSTTHGLSFTAVTTISLSSRIVFSDQLKSDHHQQQRASFFPSAKALQFGSEHRLINH